MKTKLQLNKCKCLYKLNQYELCIEEARKILLLNEVNGRSLSYLWLSLSQAKICRKIVKTDWEKHSSMKLTRVFAALASKFSEHEDRVIQILNNHGIDVQRIQIYDVCTNVDLKIVVERSLENFLVGKESLIYLKEGIYDVFGKCNINCSKCKTQIGLHSYIVSIVRTLCFSYFRLDQTTHKCGFCGQLSREHDYHKF